MESDVETKFGKRVNIEENLKNPDSVHSVQQGDHFTPRTRQLVIKKLILKWNLCGKFTVV
jgi:hypothetical protein